MHKLMIDERDARIAARIARADAACHAHSLIIASAAMFVFGVALFVSIIY